VAQHYSQRHYIQQEGVCVCISLYSNDMKHDARFSNANQSIINKHSNSTSSFFLILSIIEEVVPGVGFKQ